MPPPLALQREVEKKMREVLIDLIPRQTIHRAMTGRYWQGALSHAAPPKDGQVVPPDKRRRAGDEKSWEEFGAALPLASECAFQVDTYSGPAGDGYTLTAVVESGGEVWRRVASVGAEAARARDWEAVGKL